MNNHYFITAATYRPHSPYVETIWIYRMDEGKQELVYDGRMTRDQLISYLKSGFRFYTIVQKDDQFWPGETVRMVQGSGKEYLRIDQQNIDKDELGALPEYWSMGVLA